MKLAITTLFLLVLLVSCTNYEQPSIGVTETVMEEPDTSKPVVTTTFQGTTYGDGCYATYIGFDKEGHPCQLLTDFGLVAWWRL